MCTHDLRLGDVLGIFSILFRWLPQAVAVHNRIDDITPPEPTLEGFRSPKDIQYLVIFKSLICLKIAACISKLVLLGIKWRGAEL